MRSVSVTHRKRVSALALSALAVVLPVGAAAASSAPRAVPAEGPVLTGRLVVFLHTPPGRVAVAEHRIATLAARTDAPVKDTLPELGAMVVRPPGGETLDQARASLASDPLVASVAPEHAAYPRSVPNDPAFNAHDVPANTPNGDFYQWYLRRENFPAAWDSSGGGGTQVAMVDTGFNSVHEDLAPKIVAAVAQSGSGTEDTDGHGSHTAGLACGATNNGVGIASSGYDCGLIIEKASHPPDALPPPLGHPETWFTDGEIANAIVDATNRGAEAINLSLGGSGGLSATHAAIDYAWAHGSIPVVAALNCGYSGVQGYPAQYVQPVGTGSDQYAGEGLVVTAAQYDGSRAQFSASVGSNCPRAR